MVLIQSMQVGMTSCRLHAVDPALRRLVAADAHCDRGRAAGDQDGAQHLAAGALRGAQAAALQERGRAAIEVRKPKLHVAYRSWFIGA